MRKARRATVCLAAVTASGLYVRSASAQTALSTYYISGEISSSPSFSGAQSVSISNTSPTVFVPLGDYFEFGLSTILSGNYNPNWDDTWAQENVVQPEYLGLAGAGYEIGSTDATASILAPVLGGSRGGGEYYATDVLSNVYSGSFTDPGDVESGNGGVGETYDIFQGLFSASELNADTTAGAARLGLWGGQTASSSLASSFFTQLQYHSVSTGLVGLSPLPVTESINYWYPTSSNPDTEPTYAEAEYGGAINPTTVMAVYTSPSITWDGQADHTTWSTSAANWNYNGNTSSKYTDPDMVTFDDTAPSNSTAILLNTAVSPYLVTVNSSVNSFTISGTGSISGKANILKEGTSTLTISTQNSFSGGTIVDAGKLIVGAKNALSTNTPLTINGGTVQLATNTGLETFSSLSIGAAAALDIKNNHIIVNYSTSDPMATIYQYLASGFNNGHWNGPGIDSSTAAATSGYGIGYADGANRIVSGLSSGQIEIKYTLLGDANLDGTVNGSDFSILAANFGQGVTNWDQGDFLFTPSVNGSDFAALASNFGQGDNGADTAALDSFAIANGLAAPSFNDVPEPGVSALMSGGGLALIARRRRS